MTAPIDDNECRHCHQEIKIMVFRGTGFCSVNCQKGYNAAHRVDDVLAERHRRQVAPVVRVPEDTDDSARRYLHHHWPIV